MVDRSIVMLVYQRVNLGEINSIFMIKSHPKCYVPISSPRRPLDFRPRPIQPAGGLPWVVINREIFNLKNLEGIPWWIYPNLENPLGDKYHGTRKINLENPENTDMLWKNWERVPAFNWEIRHGTDQPRNWSRRSVGLRSFHPPKSWPGLGSLKTGARPK